jgi:UDP-N-acetylmuramate dehydrogenase
MVARLSGHCKQKPYNNGVKVSHNIPLSDYTTLHVGGPATTLVEPANQHELRDALDGTSQPFWVLGYGANCLISDKGLPGTVILNQTGEIETISATRLRADSGVNWDKFIQRTIKEGLYGLELTSGIPGGVGAAIAGNIAAYGQKVADCFVEATILDTVTGQTFVWKKIDLDFEYRGSRLQKAKNQGLVVLDATFELSKRLTSVLEYESAKKIGRELKIKPDSLEHRRMIIMETRKRAGSLLSDSLDGHWSAGSFFKNPVVDESQVNTILSFEESGISREQLLRQNQLHSGNSVRVSAAHVLLAAGFSRGQTWGNVRLHPDHILKVENTGQATAQEIYNVVQDILLTVQMKLGITLQPEVRFLGEF